MENKFCPKCGAKLLANAKFCTNCGAKQPGAQVNPATINPATPASAEVTENTSAVVNELSTGKGTSATAEPTSSTTDQTSAEQGQQSEQSNQQQQAQPKWNPPYNGSGKPSLINSFKYWFKVALHPHQCMGRADYWWGYLGFILINYALYMVFIFTNFFRLSDNPALVGMANFFGIVYGIYLLFFSILSILVTIQRLHDTGHNGWNCLWYLTLIGGIYVLVLTCLETNWQQNKWPRHQY